MTRKLDLTEDAVTVVALAGTALAYAADVDEEVERWLRVLRLYGEAGNALQAVGVDEDSRQVAVPAASTSSAPAEARIASVLTSAEEFALQRGALVVGTVDLLLAVMRVYAQDFDRALAARGTDRVELVERLDSERRAPAST